MKKLVISFAITLFLSLCAFSQEQSTLLFEYNTKPSNNTIEVYINLIDGKVNKEKPFTYYQTSKGKIEIPSKKIKKDYRLNLKKNKSLGEDCYFIELNANKEIKITANYSNHSKMTSIFFKNDRALYDIERVTLVYKDKKERRLEKIKLRCKHIIIGNLVILEF